MKSIMFIVIMAFSTTIFAQETKVSDYVEGGKVLLEFVKLFKPSNKNKNINNEDCKKQVKSDITFENIRKGIIKVALTEKNNPAKVYEAIIQTGKKESFYSISAKIYICEVVDQSTKAVIKKGDIKLTPCENPTIKLE